MQTRTSWVEVADMYASHMPLTVPRISPRTFAQCLNALFVHTKVLSNNVVSLHLYLAGQANGQNDTLQLLSRFHLELFEQTEVLRREICLLDTIPPSQNDWSIYMDLWRIPMLDNIRESLVLLYNATDELTLLYESILPNAMEKRDQSRTFYLLANQLVSLLAFLPELKIATYQIEPPISRALYPIN